MERALNPDFLEEALGQHPVGVSVLPTAAELQELLADTEVRLFTGRTGVSAELLRTAWYLHGVASASARYELYDRARQRRAFQISAHIFDLALLDVDLPRPKRMRFAFAAEVGYHRGELQPNAIAIWRRIEPDVGVGDIGDQIPTLALEAGAALLGLDRRRVMDALRGWRHELASLRRQLNVPSLDITMFAAPNAVADAVWSLLQFLAFGDRTQLDRARNRLSFAASAPESRGDTDSRWVAAHLLQLTDDIDSGSVWSLLPPDVPDVARQALTLTDPPILNLWEPQRELLRSDPSPLHSATRRVVMSVPTSAGKTLLAQLLMVAHLAQAESSICYVAPMRSLGREVRRSMRTRMRMLQREMGREVPDFAPGAFDLAAALDWLAELFAQPPDVEIMTPERLAHALRENADAVLERYGMFLFDEAHLLGEPGRGFTLEAVMSFLQWRTLNTHHRIVLLSAALGNRGQLMSWLDPTQEGLLFESEWRGPRRLNSLFTTSVDWTNELRVEPVRSQTRPRRVFFPLFGDVLLRPAQEAPVHRLRLVEPVGELAFRESEDGGERVRDGDHTTPMYHAVARLAVAISHGGPVMIVVTSRADARRMALAIAALIPRSQKSQAVTDFVRARLGEDHPLVEALNHGVAFHHAALPVDVLEAIEDAVRDDQLGFITSTTSLTEGVNLPVRTVIIHETRYEGQPPEAQLTGARLLNAMGRAGRACKECEGWVVLTENRRADVDDLDLMDVGQEELQVVSRLADESALNELAQLEEAVREAEDAVFALGANVAGEFAAFVWFVLASEEASGRSPEAVNLETLLSSTLAAVQLAPTDRDRWQAMGEEVRRTYARSDSTQRRRWARAGTTIGTARVIAGLATSVAERAADHEGISDARTALAVLNELNVLEALLQLPEAPRAWVFHQTTSTRSAEIEVAPRELLDAWVSATPLGEMAQTFLGEVVAADWRIEQLVDAVTQQFEHFLAWMLGVLLREANELLVERGAEELLCPVLPLFVRYGVNSTQALELLSSGVRSREFASVVGESAREAGVDASDMREWLRTMSIADWRARFNAGVGDVLDLIEYARTRRGGLLRALLENGEVTLEIVGAPGGQFAAVSIVAETIGDPPFPLAVMTDDRVSIGSIPTSVHAEVQAILDTGLALDGALDESSLRISLQRDEVDQLSPQQEGGFEGVEGRDAT